MVTTSPHWTCFRNKKAFVSDGMLQGENLTRLSSCLDKFDSSAVEFTFSKGLPLRDGGNTKQPQALRFTDTELLDKCCPVLHLTRTSTLLIFYQAMMRFRFPSWPTLGKTLGRPVITGHSNASKQQNCRQENHPRNMVYLFKIWEQN